MHVVLVLEQGNVGGDLGGELGAVGADERGLPLAAFRTKIDDADELSGDLLRQARARDARARRDQHCKRERNDEHDPEPLGARLPALVSQGLGPHIYTKPVI